LVIGPPGTGKTTIVTTLALLKHTLTGMHILYMTQKRGDAIGSVVMPRVDWKCVSDNLHMVFGAYEELESRPGISLLLSRAYRFKSVNSYVKYLRLLTSKPGNVHAMWLLSRLYLIKDYIGAPGNYRGVKTVILSRSMRGTYVAMLMIINAMCSDKRDELVILDDIMTLPIRESMILMITRMTRGITNMWTVLHGIGKLNVEELNVPTIITSHSGLAKLTSRYTVILNSIDEDEALYIGISEKLKINLNHVRELRQELTSNLDKGTGVNP